MARESHPWESKWRVQQRLGKGGQGLTSLVTALDSPSQSSVLKVLKNNQDPQARGRMRREVVSLDVLANAGIKVPRVLDHNTEDFDKNNVELYVVMEYISGQTLDQIINNNGTYDLDSAYRLIVNLCETIEKAHEREVLHRDLKPDNLIVRNEETSDLVVVDYGLSFNADGDQVVTETNETFRNKFLDLPETTTPGGNRRDARSDITAACAVLYFCLTGHNPGQLQGADGRLPHMRQGFSLRDKIANDNRVGQLEMLFNCAFAPNIELRFQTVREFVDRLAFVVRGSSQQVIEDPIEVAKRASARLRIKDRKTQLHDFTKGASELLAALNKYFQSVHNKLIRFRMRGDQDHEGTALPMGFDFVPVNRPSFDVSPTHHENLRRITYCVGSRGEQCVLFRKTSKRRGPNTKVESGTWEEVLFFDGDATPDSKPAIDDFQKWLCVSIEELEAEIEN